MKVNLLHNPELWRILRRDAQQAFHSQTPPGVFYAKWNMSMRLNYDAYDHKSLAWFSPPTYDHYEGMGTRDVESDFLERVLDRETQNFIRLEEERFEEQLSKTISLRDGYAERFREVEAKWSSTLPEEIEATCDHGPDPFTNAPYRSPLRAWAAQLWFHSCRDLDRWVHDWHTLSVRIGAASAILEFYRLHGELPEPPSFSSSVLSTPTLESSPSVVATPPDSKGFADGGRGPKQAGKRTERSNYEIIKAMADLRRDGLWPKVPSKSSVATALRLRLHKTGAQDGWGRRAMMGKGSTALEDLLPPYRSHVGEWDKVGAMLDEFESQGRPFRQLGAKAVASSRSKKKLSR